MKNNKQQTVNEVNNIINDNIKRVKQMGMLMEKMKWAVGLFKDDEDNDEIWSAWMNLYESICGGMSFAGSVYMLKNLIRTACENVSDEKAAAIKGVFDEETLNIMESFLVSSYDEDEVFEDDEVEVEDDRFHYGDMYLIGDTGDGKEFEVAVVYEPGPSSRYSLIQSKRIIALKHFHFEDLDGKMTCVCTDCEVTPAAYDSEGHWFEARWHGRSYKVYTSDKCGFPYHLNGDVHVSKFGLGAIEEYLIPCEPDEFLDVVWKLDLDDVQNEYFAKKPGKGDGVAVELGEGWFEKMR